MFLTKTNIKDSINNIKCFCAKIELCFLIYIYVVRQSLRYSEKAKSIVIS